MTPNLSRSQGAGRVAMVLFAICAAMPLLRRLLFSVLAPRGPALPQLLSAVEGLISFVGVIFFFVWLHRVTAAVREAEGQSRFSPGMAVGGWFIPFANFVLPYLSMRDVWQRLMKDTNGWLVPLWWSTYLLTILLRMAWSVPAVAMKIGVVPGLGLLSTAIIIAAYGSWAFMLYSIGERGRASEAGGVAGFSSAGQ